MITFTGQLNTDVAPKFIGEGDYSGARNIFLHTTKYGKGGLLRQYPGFDKIETVSQGVVVGSVTDLPTSRVYYCVKGNDSIWVYENGEIRMLLEYAFDFADFVDMAIVQNILVFTDNKNQPRAIDVDRDYVNVTEEDITLIKPAPLFPLNINVNREVVSYSPLARKAFFFSYRYVYLNNQVSVLAPYTENIYCDDDVVSINLTPNELEEVPQFADRIEVLVRESGTDFWRIISVVDRDFNVLFNGVRGRQIDITESNKPFENIPLKSKCVEVAQDRIYLANNTEGYDGYTVPSLTATEETELVGPEPTYYLVWKVIHQRQEVEFPSGDVTLTITESYWLRQGDSSVFYFLATGTETIVFNGVPVSIIPGDYTGDETELTRDQDDWTGAWDLSFNRPIGGGSFESSDFVLVEPFHEVLFTTGVVNSVGERKFKSGSQYQVGIVFYDRYLRNAGVYTNDVCFVTIDDSFRDDIIKQIGWSLNNIDSSNIPVWAESYQIVRTDNLNKSRFIQGRTSDVYFVYVESNTEKFSRTYRTDSIFIELDISGSFRAGTAYNFTQGDLIDIVGQTFRIESAVGSRIRIQSRPITEFERSVSPFPVREYYEIWTPKQESVSEIVNGEVVQSDLFYEVSEVFKVLEAGTDLRTFSVTSGFLKGDVTVIEGETFDYPDSRNISDGAFSNNTLESDPNTIVIESQNPDNISELGWIKSLGRPNVVTGIGQVQKKNFIRYSNRIIQGTRINGTSRFDFGDEASIPLENGPINVMKLTTKQQTDGTVMLAVCEQETSSIYLGETQIVDNEGQEIVGSSARVIGTINTLKGNYGTRHPTSFVRYRGRCWWWDEIGKCVVRYDPNGLKAISDNGNKSYFFAKERTPYSFFDPFHKMYFIGFGSESFGYHEESGQWRSFYDFVPESASIFDDFTLLFKDGIPYRTNGNTLSYFDGETLAEIQFYVSKPEPTVLENMSIYAGNSVFEWVGGRQVMNNDIEVLVDNFEGQQTSLEGSDFDVFEYVAYAHFFKDQNSEGGLLNGEEMRSDVHRFTIKLRNLAEIEYININEQISLGQT